LITNKLASGGAEMKIRYFADGSNMNTARLRARVPTANPVAIGSLAGYQLRFHKRSVGGSAKCNALYTGNNADVVWGVVFNILRAEKPALDRAEGLGLRGYRDPTVSVTLLTGEQLDAVTYLAQSVAIVEGLPVYAGYKDYVTSGAREHGLPAEYIAAVIDPVVEVADPSPRSVMCLPERGIGR
jgi:hypothetical protein